MAETKNVQPYMLHCANNLLTVSGVSKVVEITEREAQLKLGSTTLAVKGEGINITRLDNDKGVVELQYTRLGSLAFKSGASLKGLFR